MTNEQFHSLVLKLEEQARHDPSGYKKRVMLLALLGNAYLGVMLLLIFSLFAVLLASIVVLKALGVKLALVVGFFLWMMVKALHVKIAPPSGTEVRAKDAPELFAMIAELRRQLGAPAFHHVLVTDDFNAGVVQVPRLGLFGWHRNYLLVGLPLMKALSVEQFKAVLAHEFGHLARGHGSMSNWIYRQRLRWSRLMRSLEATDSKGSVLFKPFLNWYTPYFNAYSFPLARANEYEADAASARLVSPEAAAEALTSVNVIGCYLGERYWPQIHRQADELPQPGFAPYSDMARGLSSDMDAASAHLWLQQALARTTTVDDTHPALADRLKAIGASARLVPPGPGEAADRLLGAALGTVTAAFDRRWRDSIEPAWQERHREVQEGRRRLAELDALHEGGAVLPWKDAFERASLTEGIGANPDSALAQFRALHEQEPENAWVNFGLGARLLARGEESGVGLVEHAMQLDEQVILQGCAALRDFYWQRGKEEQARMWHQRLAERTELLDAAERERNAVRVKDKFERHGLPMEALEELRVQLRAIPGLHRAYLVRKQTQHFQQHPCYVLGFSASGMLQLHTKRRVADMLQAIQTSVRFPGETLIINVDGGNYRFGRKFRWMRGARIL